MPKTDLPQGTLDLLVLKTLTHKPLHGYAIAQWLQRITDDALRLEEGTLYPALYRMEQRAWISSEWGMTEHKRKARYYRLTSLGRKQLKAEVKAWAELSDMVSKILQTA